MQSPLHALVQAKEFPFTLNSSKPEMLNANRQGFDYPGYELLWAKCFYLYNSPDQTRK
jgi:hypothetical protein